MTANNLPTGITVEYGEVRGACLVCGSSDVFWGLEEELVVNGGRDTAYTYKHGFVCDRCIPREIEFAKRQGVLWE